MVGSGNNSKSNYQLRIEPGCPLQIEFEGLDFRFTSTLVRINLDDYLIVKTPKDSSVSSTGTFFDGLSYRLTPEGGGYNCLDLPVPRNW